MRYEKGHWKNYWTKRNKYDLGKSGPEDSELIWPESEAPDVEEEDIPRDVDVLELMSRNLEAEPEGRPRGGYKVHAWRDEWVE
jgi:hypothetical protein